MYKRLVSDFEIILVKYLTNNILSIIHIGTLPNSPYKKPKLEALVVIAVYFIKTRKNAQSDERNCKS